MLKLIELFTIICREQWLDESGHGPTVLLNLSAKQLPKMSNDNVEHFMP